MSRETTFENVRVGDKVWSFRYGYGKVIDIDLGIPHPLTIKTMCGDFTYLLDGKLDKHMNRDLFWDEIKFQIPERPLRITKKTVHLVISKIKVGGSYKNTNAYENVDNLPDYIDEPYEIITFEIEVTE